MINNCYKCIFFCKNNHKESPCLYYREFTPLEMALCKIKDNEDFNRGGIANFGSLREKLINEYWKIHEKRKI